MIIKYSIKDFKKHKNKILKLIDAMPKIFMKAKGANISKTDWLLTPEYNRDYWVYLRNLLIPFFVEMENKYGGIFSIQNFWFQQYHKLDYHGWHNHSHCHFSSVVYLECSNQTDLTQFKDMPIIDAKEGDVITFPSYIFHRSPLINSSSRKTIVSFNSNIIEHK